MTRDAHEQRGGFIEPTIVNLGIVAQDVARYLEAGKRLAPVEIWDHPTRGRIISFQTWAGRLADGHPEASLEKTLGSAIGLRTRLAQALEEYFFGALPLFVSMADKMRSKAPNLYAAKGKAVESAVATFTAKVNAKRPRWLKESGEQKFRDLVELVEAHNVCQDLIVALRPRAEEEIKAAERAALKADAVKQERKTLRSLAALSEMKFV